MTNDENRNLEFEDQLPTNSKIALRLCAEFQTAMNRVTTDVINSIHECSKTHILSTVVAAYKSSISEMLKSVDFTATINKILSKFSVDDDILARFRYNTEIYYKTMYECKWFPYIAWSSDISLFRDVSKILETSRGKSMRREKRIDRAIISYYTTDKIKSIQQSWRESDLEPYIRKIICQAIEAHLRGEFALTVACLATMWEGLIHKRAKITERRKMNKTKEDFKDLIDTNDFETIFFEYVNDYIISQCNTNDDVIDGVPNRNGVSHSKYNKYPSKKASLNAILITDFIIKLKPKTNI